MAKSFTRITKYLSSPVLERWPNNSYHDWTRAQQFCLVLAVEGDWWLEKKTIINGYSRSTFDTLYRREVVIPILSSEEAACVLDVKRLRSALTARGCLAKAMLKIERGRRLWWNENRQEIEGELNERAEEAIRDIEYFIEEEPLHTEETVMTVEEHLCGFEFDTPPREVLKQYGLEVEASKQHIETVAKQIEEDFRKRNINAYGSFVSALKSIIQRELDG